MPWYILMNNEHFIFIQLILVLYFLVIICLSIYRDGIPLMFIIFVCFEYTIRKLLKTVMELVLLNYNGSECCETFSLSVVCLTKEFKFLLILCIKSIIFYLENLQSILKENMKKKKSKQDYILYNIYYIFIS